MKMLTIALMATGLLLGTTACGHTAAEPSPSPSVTATAAPETYGECVDQIPMDPDDVQGYIDRVHEECGEP